MATQKLKQLRDWLRKHQLDAYLMPHADRFQSEYLAPRDERLAWLTHFTGSSGSAVVLADTAALFTDGRYTLQALDQVDTTVYDVVETPPGKIADWLQQHLPAGGVIGFDPLLWTAAQIKNWHSVCAEKNWTLQAVSDNPIDLFWNDRPADDIQAAQAHPLQYAGAMSGDKINSALDKLSPKVERLLVSDPGLVCWLLNLRGRDVAHVPVLQSLCVLRRDGAVTLLTDKRKITDSVRQFLGNRVTIKDLTAFEAVLTADKSSLQIDPAQLPQAVKELAQRHEVPLVEATDPIILLRACKNQTEIDGARLAHKKDAVAFEKFHRWFYGLDFAHDVVTELDVIQKLHDCRAADPDFIDASFDTIAGYGSNGAIVHYRASATTNQRLLPGSLFLLDSGGQYLCGTTDITRTYAIGTPTEEMKRHAQAVYDGMRALSAARFPAGTTGAQLEALARRPVWEAGQDYTHGTGHGVGAFMSVHEGPQGFHKLSTAPLLPGMILSVEPGTYRAGLYGIRLENLVVVVEDKQLGDERDILRFETLTNVPFDNTLVDTRE